MPEQQLVDYIKKARQAGQSDDQTRALLYKNGWTEAELSDVFSAIDQSQPQTQPEAQPQAQPQVKPQAYQQPQPQVQAAQNNYEASRKRKEGRLVFLIILIVIILAIAGAGMALAFRIWDPSWNPFRPSPESVILEAWSNLAGIKSENFNSELSLIGKNIKANGSSGSFNIDEKASGGEDAKNGLADIQASLTASATDNAANNYNLSIAGEARLIQKDLYLELSDVNLGTLGMILEMFGAPDPSTLKGQWIRFQMNSSTQQDIMQQVQSLSGQQTKIDQNFKDTINKIVKILLDKKVYDINQLSDNNGSEGKEYHYYVSLNQKKLIAASPEIFSVFQNYYNESNPGQPLPPEYTLANFQESINDAFDKIGKAGVDLFIGKTDNFFHKINFAKDLDISRFTDQASGTVQISYDLVQAGINKPVQVSAPANYKDFQDIIGPSLKKQKIEADMNQVEFAAQSIFSASTGYSALCIKGLLSGYIKKGLLGLSNDIVSQGAEIPVCFSSVQNYCVSTQLADGNFMCVGPGGTGAIKCVSAKTICK